MKKLFGFKPKEVVVKEETIEEPIEEIVEVAVPDIKEYLVREYERARVLVDKIAELEQELEMAKETQLKYEASLVTLDEYSRRLKASDLNLCKKDELIKELNGKVKKANDDLNSYKIRFNEAAITKEAIKDEVVTEFKLNLAEAFNAVKGNLSKSIVAKIINETELGVPDGERRTEGKHNGF